MQDPLPIWKAQYELIPKDGVLAAPQGALNIANYVSQRVTGKLTLAPIIGGPPAIFTFNPAAFAAPLSALVPSPDPITGKTAMANAWQAAALASVMLVTPGAYVGAPTPATIFSVVACVVNPASVAAAYAALLSSMLALQATPLPSQIPDLLYAAFASLTYNLTGLNSIPPPAGPLPLTAIAVPVL